RKSLLSFVSTALHESLHLNGHTTLEVNEYEDGRIASTNYRQGISVFAVQKKGFNGEFHSHFDGLHEAIVSEQQKRSLQDLINNPLLQQDRDILFSKQVQNLKNTIAEDNPDIQEEDILWVSEKGEDFYYIS